jgi:hypothetical protein
MNYLNDLRPLWIHSKCDEKGWPILSFQNINCMQKMFLKSNQQCGSIMGTVKNDIMHLLTYDLQGLSWYHVTGHQ